MLLQLEHDGALDIPAGAASFTVTDELELPVAVQVLAVYPHAHYVAREVQAIARRPDGSTEWLVHIADWNLDWQAVYELATPLSLPRGTRDLDALDLRQLRAQRAQPSQPAAARHRRQPRLR